MLPVEPTAPGGKQLMKCVPFSVRFVLDLSSISIQGLRFIWPLYAHQVWPFSDCLSSLVNLGQKSCF